MQSRLRQIQRFLIRWEVVIVAIICVLIVGIASFAFGMMRGAELVQKPLQVYIPAEDPAETVVCSADCTALGLNTTDAKEVFAQTNTPQGGAEQVCAFVGSVHGTKYYPPNCAAVKRISPANLTCFASAQDAQEKGYTLTTSCS